MRAAAARVADGCRCCLVLPSPRLLRLRLRLLLAPALACQGLEMRPLSTQLACRASASSDESARFYREYRRASSLLLKPLPPGARVRLLRNAPNSKQLLPLHESDEWDECCAQARRAAAAERGVA